MQLKALAVVLSSALALGTRAQQLATSSTTWNDNSLMSLQGSGGDSQQPGDVKIKYFGHDAFEFISPKGVTILVDPWRNDPTDFYGKWFLNKFPAIPVDVVLSTHAHFDHDAVEAPQGLMVLERLVGEFKLGDVQITGIADKHQCKSDVHHKWDRASADFHIQTCPPDNVESFDNAIQIIQTGGLRIVVWGDNRKTPDSRLDAGLKDADVLILPIDDSQTILTHAEVDAIVERFNPKAVIPAHYLLSGVSTDVTGLKSAEKWVADQKDVHRADVRRPEQAQITLNKSELQGAHHRVYYFADHVESKP